MEQTPDAGIINNRHAEGAVVCTLPDCGEVLHGRELLRRHQDRHNEEGKESLSKGRATETRGQFDTYQDLLEDTTSKFLHETGEPAWGKQSPTSDYYSNYTISRDASASTSTSIDFLGGISPSSVENWPYITPHGEMWDEGMQRNEIKCPEEEDNWALFGPDPMGGLGSWHVSASGLLEEKYSEELSVFGVRLMTQKATADDTSNQEASSEKYGRGAASKSMPSNDGGGGGPIDDNEPSSNDTQCSGDSDTAETTTISSFQSTPNSTDLDSLLRARITFQDLQDSIWRGLALSLNAWLHGNLQRAYTGWPSALQGIRAQAGGEGPRSLADNPSIEPSGTSCNIQNSLGKRKLIDGTNVWRNEDDQNSDEESNQRPRKKSKRAAEDPSLPRRRLKCPYHQRRPEEYSRAACRGEGFVDMPKLKDHLKRVHTRPLQCVRCWGTMKSNAARDQHLQQDPICEVVSEPMDDRIPTQRLLELNFNGGLFGQAKTVEEKWRILYRILFPAEEFVPSPYETLGMTLQFEKLFTKILEEELSKELGPALSRIQGRLCEIIQRCKDLTDQASRTSQSSGTPSSDQMPVPNDTGFAMIEASSILDSIKDIDDWPVDEWKGMFDAPFQTPEEWIGSWGDQKSGLIDKFLRQPFSDNEPPQLLQGFQPSII